MLQDAVNIAGDFLQGIELYRGNAYWDNNGYAVGYGNHYYQDGSAVRSGDTISKTDALDLLMYYANTNGVAIANQLNVSVPVGLLAALISLRYNCGTITVSLLNLINSGADLDTIKQQFIGTCDTEDGVYSPRLHARRLQEWQLVETSLPSWMLPAFIGIGLLALLKK